MNKKLTLAALALGAGLTTSAMTQAETFEVTIEVTDIFTALALVETTPMKFPTIVLDGASANGHTCYTANAGSSALCPNAVAGTDKNNSVFTVSGTPLDVVAISTNDPANQNGLGLSVNTPGSVTLDADGNGSFPTWGLLRLTDINAVQPSTTFEYEVIVSYA